MVPRDGSGLEVQAKSFAGNIVGETTSQTLRMTVRRRISAQQFNLCSQSQKQKHHFTFTNFPLITLFSSASINFTELAASFIVTIFGFFPAAMQLRK